MNYYFQILLVCLVNNSHWISYKLNLKIQVIYIYDSLAHKTKDEPFRRERDIMCLRWILTLLLQSVVYFQQAGLELRQDMFDAMWLPLVDVIPLFDGNNFDMFCLAFLDSIVYGLSIRGMISQKKIADLHLDKVLQIFLNSIDLIVCPDDW